MGKIKDFGQQSTLVCATTLSGTGVHTGRPSRVTLHPAEVDTGICFRRTDLTNGTRSTVIRVQHHNVGSTKWCTEMRNGDGVSVMTVEHLLAALGGAGIDNCDIHVSGPEIPILDGSSRDFLSAIYGAGIEKQHRARGYIRVLQPVSLKVGMSSAEFLPDTRSVIETKIDFSHPAIGCQEMTYVASAASFDRDIATARTFGFLSQAKELRSRGFGLGASLDNTVVLDDSSVMNHNGLRFADEFVRHKTLDVCGDLMFAGAPIVGLFRTYRGGHHLNHAAINCLLAQQEAWEYIVADEPKKALITAECVVAVGAAS